ncbi:MAG: hypothetical protein ACOCQR_03320 [bacterium]
MNIPDPKTKEGEAMVVVSIVLIIIGLIISPFNSEVGFGLAIFALVSVAGAANN